MVTIVIDDVNDNAPQPINNIDPVVILCINDFEENTVSIWKTALVYLVYHEILYNL